MNTFGGKPTSGEVRFLFAFCVVMAVLLLGGLTAIILNSI